MLCTLATIALFWALPPAVGDGGPGARAASHALRTHFDEVARHKPAAPAVASTGTATHRSATRHERPFASPVGEYRFEPLASADALYRTPLREERPACAAVFLQRGPPLSTIA